MGTSPVTNLKNCRPTKAGGFVKLYARGKIGLLFDGPEKYRKTVQQCFKQALDVSVRFDDILFARLMRAGGTPEVAIRQFLDSCTIIDEARLDESGFTSES